MNLLDDILVNKKKEIEARKKIYTLSFLKKQKEDLSPVRSFASIIKKNKKIKLIAEIKSKSPSSGIIRQDFNYVNLAKIYEQSGVAAISILTDKKYFGGDLSYLKDIRKSVNLPLLRKDFIINKYQIYETKYYGGDCILLIVKILKKKTRSFLEEAKKIGLEAIVEVHNKEELNMALQAEAKIIGINNRDLKTFKTDINTSFELIKYIPKDKIIISESGIKTKEDVFLLQNIGVDAILVGEVLVKSKNIEKKIKELLSN